MGATPRTGTGRSAEFVDGGGGGGQTLFSGTGASTNAPVTVFTHTNAKGNIGIGSIVNTGVVNDLKVHETAIDLFGNTITFDTIVPAGSSYILNGPQTNFNDQSLPPYTSYRVQVEDGFSGSHTTYEVHYTGIGAVV